MAEADEEIRKKLRQQLEQTGISSVVRRMVHDICNTKEDLHEINPDAVVSEVYRQGLMKNFLENLNQQGHHHEKLKKEHVSDIEIERILSKHPSLIPQNFDDSSDSDIIDEQLLKSGRYYLKMQIDGGKAFLDHLLDEDANMGGYCEDGDGAESGGSKLVLHVFYKSQRFNAKPVVSRCDPDFRETFLIEIGRFDGFDGSVANKLLNINEPLRIMVVREDVNLNGSCGGGGAPGGGVLVAYCRHDWRTILITENGHKNFSLELMGIGSEHNVCVGILRVRFTLVPIPNERISENAYLDKANEDGACQEDFERFVVTVAKRWWKEYIEIRTDHQFRLVRLFAYDENMTARPVTMFIKPVLLEDLLVIPFQAAWFVALIPTTKSNQVSANNGMQASIKKGKALPGIQNGTGGCSLSERWQNIETTITAKSGTVEDHAVLLASIFLGFGLDAYVALGTKKGKGSWAWTITMSENEQEPTFWESTTGEYYDHFSLPNDTGSSEHLCSDALHRVAKNSINGFLTISCIFNGKGFYANVQPTIKTDFVDWNLGNPSKWKALSYSNSSHSSHVSVYPFRLQASVLNWDFVTKKLDFQLKHLLITARKEQRLGTKWDDQLCQYMSQHLHREELEVSTGGENFKDYFRTVALRVLPPDYEFRAHTFHSRSTEAHVLFSKVLREPLLRDIIFPEGDNVKHSLKVKIFPYPEDVVSIRFMAACTFIPVS